MRRIDLDADYPTICEWWLGHGWPAIPREMLPRWGFIEDGVCAGFIYSTDSKIAIMEWIVSNPKAAPRAIVAGLKDLMGEIQATAHCLGFDRVMTFINRKSLGKIYEGAGFKMSEDNLSLYIWG